MENAAAPSPSPSEHEQPATDVVYEYRADFIPASETICDAAPSQDDSVGNYSTFNCNPVENAVKQFNRIKVTHSVDELGRDFYYFDDFGMKSMAIVLFETPAGDLISVNEIVMPLDQFLDISHINQATVNSPAKTESGDIREIMSDSGRYGIVSCKTRSGKKFSIPNSNVKMIMMALSVLSDKIYDDESDVSDYDTESDESDNEEPVAEACPLKKEEQLGLIRRLVRWLW